MITYGTRVWYPLTGNIGIALGSFATISGLTDDWIRKQIFVDFGDLFLGHSLGGYIDTDTGWLVSREDLEELPERFAP